MIPSVLNQIKSWCRGRNPWIRLPFIIGFGYIFIRQCQDPLFRSIFGGLNLGIHELGHMIFGLFGEFIGMAGGTILQISAPFYGVYNFIKQEDYFAAVLCFGWLSTNFYNVAYYAADARAMAIPLVSPFGGHVYHDWNYMLSKTGLLMHDALIGSIFRLLGLLSMVLMLGAGIWMIVLMLKSKESYNEDLIV